MRAVVYHGQLDVRAEQIPVPVCGEGELLAKVDACAVCGSDMKAYLSGNPRMKPPIVVGHEFAAVIVEAKTSGFSVGERIVMATSISCGTCAYCLKDGRISARIFNRWDSAITVAWLNMSSFLLRR